MLLDDGVAKDKRELYGYGCAAAAGSGCVEIVTMLLEAGADRDMRDRWGKSAEEHAAGSGHQEVLCPLTDRGFSPHEHHPAHCGELIRCLNNAATRPSLMRGLD